MKKRWVTTNAINNAKYSRRFCNKHWTQYRERQNGYNIFIFIGVPRYSIYVVCTPILVLSTSFYDDNDKYEFACVALILMYCIIIKEKKKRSHRYQAFKSRNSYRTSNFLNYLHTEDTDQYKKDCQASCLTALM